MLTIEDRQKILADLSEVFGRAAKMLWADHPAMDSTPTSTQIRALFELEGAAARRSQEIAGMGADAKATKKA